MSVQNEAPTGSDDTIIQSPPLALMVNPGKVSMTGSDAEERAECLSSSGTSLTGKSPMPRSRREAGVASTDVVPAREMPQLRHIFNSCVEAVAAATEAEDFMERANAVDDLRSSLSRLYEHRGHREIQFGDFVAHLQGILLERSADNVGNREIEAIGRVLRELARMPSLTDPESRRLEEILVKAECHVFREMF